MVFQADHLQPLQGQQTWKKLANILQKGPSCGDIAPLYLINMQLLIAKFLGLYKNMLDICQMADDITLVGITTTGSRY